jgi:hypothetical protein
MALYDIESLKEDLPTAKELAQFVYDKIGISLDLIGKPKADQYLAAKNALEGKKIPAEYISEVNPYVDKRELIPQDELRIMPERSKDLPPISSRVHFFGATNMPHPIDPQSDRKVQIDFHKYDNGSITYTITGPVEQIAVGERINKFGVKQPEKYEWMDPRTEETLLRRPDGTFTEKGRGIYAYCIGEKGGGIWPMIDRNFLATIEKNVTNPWA